jgi:plasmid maintenance system antidote protein VapI
MMTGHEYQRVIRSLGMRPTEAARFLGVNATTTRRWISGEHPIPKPVAILLRTMLRHKLSPRSIETE